MNGTDYVDKNDVTRGMGPRKVIEQILKCKCDFFVDLDLLQLDTGLPIFPRSDYDPAICREDKNAFIPPAELHVKCSGGVSQPLSPKVGWQLAYWLIDWSGFECSRVYGDPVNRYWCIQRDKRPAPSRKRKRDEDIEEQRPEKRQHS